MIVASSEKPGSVATIRDSTLVDWCNQSPEYLSATCPTAYWTSCDGSTLMSGGGAAVCTGSSTCNYDVIHTGSEVDTESSLRWYHCVDRAAISFYREVPPGPLWEATSTERPLESSSNSGTTASPASTGTSVASQTSTSTSSPTAAPSAKESSKVWIAGVVVGVVGLLAAAALGFFLWRRRRNSHAYGPTPQDPTQTHMQAGYTTQQGAFYPQQRGYGNGSSPYFQPGSPNMGAYDPQIAKPHDSAMYGGYAAPQYGSPLPATELPPSSPAVPPQVTAELPGLASPSAR